MSATLEEQKAELESALADTSLSQVTRNALETQLSSVKRKITGRDNRIAILDGVEIRAGSTVYIADEPSDYQLERNPLTKATVVEKTVCAVSPKGDELCIDSGHHGGRHNYRTAKSSFSNRSRLFGSTGMAVDAISASAAQRIERANEEVAKANATLERLEDYAARLANGEGVKL